MVLLIYIQLQKIKCILLIEIANALGINNTKVAVLSATELVNPALQSALDAYELVLMNEKAAIRGYIVDVLYVQI